MLMTELSPSRSLRVKGLVNPDNARLLATFLPFLQSNLHDQPWLSIHAQGQFNRPSLSTCSAAIHAQAHRAGGAGERSQVQSGRHTNSIPFTYQMSKQYGATVTSSVAYARSNRPSGSVFCRECLLLGFTYSLHESIPDSHTSVGSRAYK